MNLIDVGAAWQAIVIDEPVPMSGFAARLEPSTGTAAVVPRATALAVDEVTLVFLDVVAVDSAFTAMVTERCEGRVVVSASHTHAGPGVLSCGLGALSEHARQAFVDAAVQAVSHAREARRPSIVEWMTPLVPGLAFDRRRLEPSPDAPLKALRWLVDGEVVGCLVSHPCHPTALGPTNRELSPDYPGFVRTTVEAAWGGVCVFATGCAGDLNTGQSPEASFSTGAGDAGRTMADAERFGSALGGAVVGGEWTAVDLSRGVAFAGTTIDLHQQPLDADPPEIMAAHWRAQRVGADAGVVALLDEWIGWAETTPATLADVAARDGEVTWVGIGDVDLVLLPGEPFLDAARTIDAHLPRAITLGYAQDVPGYFPSATEYARGGYEVIDAHRYYRQPAPFVQGSLERLVDAGLDVVRHRRGATITRVFDFDGGRRVTVKLPSEVPTAVVFAADGGWHIDALEQALATAGTRDVALVGVDGRPDDDGRLVEYSPSFNADQFAAHEQFFVEQVGGWVRDDLGIDLPASRTAIWGASLGGELSIALALRHPGVFGTLLCASPGGGYQPPDSLPTTLPRARFVGGLDEPFFLDNARRWADALTAAGTEVVMTERPGEHGGAFWMTEFPLMVQWAFTS